MITVEFNNEEQYLHSTFEGEITKQELIDYIDAIRLNNLYPRKLKIIIDSTHAKMKLAKEDLRLVFDANLKSLAKYDFIFEAIITLYPKETAYSIMYKEMSATKQYKFEVFSTKDAALKWLADQ